MTTYYSLIDGNVRVLVKGQATIVIERCTHIMSAEG